MFRRKIVDSMNSWKAEPNHKCLVIIGARRVGKTYIIDNFIRNNYRSFVKIDFVREPDMKEIFKGNLDPDTILNGIKARRRGFNPIDGETALFFDEVQACPEARMCMKYLSEDGRCDVLASGSLLGFTYSDSFDDYLDSEGTGGRGHNDNPVGYEHILEMRSMDFEEYLWARGISENIIGSIRDCISEKIPLNSGLLTSMDSLFREYMAVGGMPQVVAKFIEGGYPKAREEQKDIVIEYRGDIGKYTKPAMRNRVVACFRSIPQQLARTDKKFIFKDVEADFPGNSRFYAGSLSWLVDAGIITQCMNVTEPVNPLEERVRKNYFKVYVNDTGLLLSMYSNEVVTGFLDGYSSINAGAIVENAIMEAISKSGTIPFYFSNKTLEIDFIMSMGKDVAALEVKSGNNNRSKSLDSVSKKWNVGRLIKFENGNISVDNRGIEHYPLFAAAFIDDIRGKTDIVKPIDVDLINALYGRT